MPSLLYYVQRAGEQPFRETLNQALSLVNERAQAFYQPARDAVFTQDASIADLIRQSGFRSGDDWFADLRDREWPELPWNSDGAVQEAENVLDGRVAVLGSKEIGRSPMPWHTDIKSGFTWPLHHFRRLRLTPAAGVDVKVPWELSRCHHLVTLGIAYRHSRDERFSLEAVCQIRDWIERNPARRGINWVSPMEAGIRAVNWCWTLALIRESRHLDATVAMCMLQSLHTHASYIFANLERRTAWLDGRQTTLNSNHYLCDLAGLLTICRLFPELKLSRQAAFAERELGSELRKQVHSDGTDYEHSTAYHRFVFEIFRYARTFIPLPEEILEAMKRFAAASLNPDGSLVQAGDNDSGRLLPRLEAKITPEQTSRSFEDAGFYSMRGKDAHVFVSAAGVGMNGFGSHSHNDLLSFEYFSRGRKWLVDPGTYAYLPDVAARNWFRSTAAHNGVRIDREEIRPFHVNAVFQLAETAKIRVAGWTPSEDTDILEAEHEGYSRLRSPVIHNRRFRFDKRTGFLEIFDRLTGAGVHAVEWFFQVPPEVRVEITKPDAFQLECNGMQVRVRFQQGHAKLTLIPGWYSPAYGVRLPATTVVARGEIEVPCEARIMVEPC